MNDIAPIIGVCFAIYLGCIYMMGIAEIVLHPSRDNTKNYVGWQRAYWLSNKLQRLSALCLGICALAVLTPNNDNPVALAGLHIVIVIPLYTIADVIYSVIEDN